MSESTQQLIIKIIIVKQLNKTIQKLNYQLITFVFLIKFVAQIVLKSF